VIEYLKVFTWRGADEIAELERATVEEPYKRLAQRALADDLTTLVHSAEDAAAANQAAQALFGRDELRDLDEQTLRGVAAEIGAADLPWGTEAPSVVDALAASGVVASRSAGRRAIVEGGAYVNNTKVTDPDALLTEDDLIHGQWVILRRGKRTVGGVVAQR